MAVTIKSIEARGAFRAIIIDSEGVRWHAIRATNYVECGTVKHITHYFVRLIRAGSVHADGAAACRLLWAEKFTTNCPYGGSYDYGSLVASHHGDKTCAQLAQMFADAGGEIVE